MRKPSQSAILVAAARALHREEPPPHVLDDWLALPLAGDDANALAERLRTDLPREALLGFSRWLCVRARVPEEIAEQEAQRGVRQYVILGAGLDSYAYRRSDLADKMRIFEVDHPASQEWKRQRLAELKVPLPPNLVLAPVDFEHQALREGLEAAGFDWNAPAVFSWIGVTMYLTMDAIRSTLETVAAGPAGTRIVLTYNQPPSVLQGMGIETSQALRPILDEMGEPIITTFVPSEIEELLRSMGFVDVTHFGPDEAVREYFPGRTDVRFGGAQRIAIARVST
jgi:methyltransferase (TIGR00027 family)